MAKEPSEKQLAARKAFGEAAKARAAANKTTTTGPETVSVPKKVEIDANQLKDLMDRLASLEAAKTSEPFTPEQQQAQAQQGAQQSAQQGTNPFTQKSTVFKKFPDRRINTYPDPTARLYEENEFRRFAIKDNYEIKFDAQVTPYETKWGWVEEPRFFLTLSKRLFDDAGEPRVNEKGQPVVAKLRVFMVHDDPSGFIQTAHDAKLDVEGLSDQDLLDTVRYYIFKNFLLEFFFPPKIETYSNRIKEEVIGGMVVQITESSTLA